MLTKCSFLTGDDIPGIRQLFRNTFIIGLKLAPANTSTLSYYDDEGNYYAAILKRANADTDRVNSCIVLIKHGVGEVEGFIKLVAAKLQYTAPTLLYIDQSDEGSTALLAPLIPHMRVSNQLDNFDLYIYPSKVIKKVASLPDGFSADIFKIFKDFEIRRCKPRLTQYITGNHYAPTDDQNADKISAAMVRDNLENRPSFGLFLQSNILYPIAWVMLDSETFLEIHVVDDFMYRGKGVARVLLTHAMNVLGQEYKELRFAAKIGRDNEKAIKLFEAEGFVKQERFPMVMFERSDEEPLVEI